MTTASPLSWPAGWPRSKSRKPAKFGKGERVGASATTSGYISKRDLTIGDGVKRVLDELGRFGAKDAIISTNLAVRRDGLPYADQRAPTDPGVAVYWKAGGSMKVMAIDRYDRVADNLAAIAATLEAMRAIERHGGGQVLERAFLGFTQLPSPNNWRHVLGLTSATATLESARAAYRRLAMEMHPDRGGSQELMSVLNAAWGAAQREIGS